MWQEIEAQEPEPERHIGYLIRRAQQLHVAVWARVVSTEISSVQYSILVLLERHSGASQRELCDMVDLDRSTIAELVSRMERRGLISRHRDPDDGRRNTLEITGRGLLERQRLRPLVEKVQEELVAPLAQEDRALLWRALRAVVDRDDGAPPSRR